MSALSHVAAPIICLVVGWNLVAYAIVKRRSAAWKCAGAAMFVAGFVMLIARTLQDM